MSDQFTAQTNGEEKENKRQGSRSTHTHAHTHTLSLSLSLTIYLGGFYSGVVRQIREYLLQDNGG